jgi:hypothetical protein
VPGVEDPLEEPDVDERRELESTSSRISSSSVHESTSRESLGTADDVAAIILIA